MTTMTCKVCALTKSLDDFYAHASSKNNRAQPCKTCCIKKAAENAAKHQERDPEGYAAQKRKHTRNYRARNAGNEAVTKQVADTKHAWNQANKAHNTTVSAAWRANNPAKVKAAKKRHHRKHAAKIVQRVKRWRIANPAKRTLAHTRERVRRQSLLTSLPHTFTEEQHQFMDQYWGFACAVCGNQEGLLWTLALDHWIPLTSPDCPGTIASNLLPLCHGQGGCNNRKHNKMPSVWLREAFPPRKARTIEKAIAEYFAKAKAQFGDNGVQMLL
jgi:hypothetical protein